MTLTPAFGRDYKSAAAVKADFDANKDFIIADIFGGHGGQAVNRSELIGKERSVTIRYAKLRNVVVVKVA